MVIRGHDECRTAKKQGSMPMTPRSSPPLKPTLGDAPDAMRRKGSMPRGQWGPVMRVRSMWMVIRGEGDWERGHAKHRYIHIPSPLPANTPSSKVHNVHGKRQSQAGSAAPSCMGHGCMGCLVMCGPCQMLK